MASHRNNLAIILDSVIGHTGSSTINSADGSHPPYSEFELLPSGHQFRVPGPAATYIRRLLFPVPYRLLTLNDCTREHSVSYKMCSLLSFISCYPPICTVYRMLHTVYLYVFNGVLCVLLFYLSEEFVIFLSKLHYSLHSVYNRVMLVVCFR